MRRCIGVAVTTDEIVAGAVNDNKLTGSFRIFPEKTSHHDELSGMPADMIARTIGQQIEAAAQRENIDAIGVGIPGIILSGIVEDSPNLQQLKGAHMRDMIANALGENLRAPVFLYNDADAVAAGLAARTGQMERIMRVWTLGAGIGYGMYPWREGYWEGGHMVISLDPAERFCGCGGTGHVEGIMGHRAMRLRFLDMEPDEVFERAGKGDPRCSDFMKLWHRALAAATATSIHMAGPGKFFITGPDARQVDLVLLNQYLHEMVKMSPLQSYVFEIVPEAQEVAVVGAAVNALRAVSLSPEKSSLR